MKWWQIVWAVAVGIYGLAFGGWVVLRVIAQPASLRWIDDIVLLCLGAFTLPALGLYAVFAFLDWAARVTGRGMQARRLGAAARA
jgi:hypothetical protein